ncbi:MAG: RNA polymerase sigma factor [Eubacteriales bacterium]
MTEDERLLAVFENEMLPKIYGFCRMKMTTSEDAEDLAQDICLEIVRTIRTGKPIDNLNAFVWSVSNHMFYNLLRRKKYGTTAYLSDLISSEVSMEEEFLLREQKTLLRRELSLLSGNFRKAVILHYYENLTCRKIGQILGKSEGTVKWWLHDAKKVIEKGMSTVRDFGERSYRPGALYVSCTGMPGSGNEPLCCAERKSAQNILLAAYRQPMAIEELCGELGISAPYIEDEVDYLVKNELMKEITKGKYQTDFVILPNGNDRLAINIFESAFPAYFDKLISFLESKKEILTGNRFNMAGFEWNRLLWVYLHIFTESVIEVYKNETHAYVKYDDIPMRPNGGRWIALGFDGSAGSCQKREEPGFEILKFCHYDGPVQKTGEFFVQGFFHTWSKVNSDVFFDTPDDVFALCRNIIKGNTDPRNLTQEQEYLFSIALEKKLFLKTSEGFRQNYYYAGRDEWIGIEKMAHEFYPEVSGLIGTAYDLALKEYQSGVPKHLRWQMGNFLSNYLNLFVPFSLYEAVGRGMLSNPCIEGREWLSLFASE